MKKLYRILTKSTERFPVKFDGSFFSVSVCDIIVPSTHNLNEMGFLPVAEEKIAFMSDTHANEPEYSVENN